MTSKDGKSKILNGFMTSDFGTSFEKHFKNKTNKKKKDNVKEMPKDNESERKFAEIRFQICGLFLVSNYNIFSFYLYKIRVHVYPL